MMSTKFTMPYGLAETQEQFRELFYNVRNNDWNNCKGFAFAHVCAYELDELILNTPGMSSPDIDDAKIDLAEEIAHYIKDECATLPKTGKEGFIYLLRVPSPIYGERPTIVKKYWDGTQYQNFKGAVVDVAYDLLHRLYIPTEEEYEYLCKKEYGDCLNNTPIVEGVYDSVTKEESGWFNYCLSRWNKWHEEHADADENDRAVAKSLKEFSKAIKDEWDAMPPAEQESWKRG